jgi:hypothetical protein
MADSAHDIIVPSSPSNEVTVSTVVMKPVVLSSVATAIMKGEGAAPGRGKARRLRALDKVAGIKSEPGCVIRQR